MAVYTCGTGISQSDDELSIVHGGIRVLFDVPGIDDDLRFDFSNGFSGRIVQDSDKPVDPVGMDDGAQRFHGSGLYPIDLFGQRKEGFTEAVLTADGKRTLQFGH